MTPILPHDHATRKNRADALPHAVLARQFVAAAGGELSMPHRALKHFMGRLLAPGPGIWIPDLGVLESRVLANIANSPWEEGSALRNALVAVPGGVGAVLLCFLHSEMVRSRWKQKRILLEAKARVVLDVVKRLAAGAPIAVDANALPPVLVQRPAAAAPPRATPVPSHLLNLIAISVGKTVRMTPGGYETARSEAQTILSILGADQGVRDALARALMVRAGANKPGLVRDSAIIKTAREVSREMAGS